MEQVNPEIAGANNQAGPSSLPADGPPDPASSDFPSQADAPRAKKPKLENPKVQGLKAEALAEGGKLPGTPRTPRLAREVSPSNPLLTMSARQMAKKEQEALKEEERRKRAENEELLKAQRKAARHAALEHKGEETRSPEELVGQVVWAKVGTYPWWPAQIVDPATVDTQSLAGRKSDTEVLARFFGTYDYAWVERRTNVSDFETKFIDRKKKCSKKKTFPKALEEALECQKSGALPEAWTFQVEEEPVPEEAPPEEPPATTGEAEESPPPEVAAVKERKRKGKAPVVEDRSKAARRARQLRIMRHLGLAPPEGSPFTHEQAVEVT